MQEYSLVISIWGWSAVNKLSGKELSGQWTDLPRYIADELTKFVKPNGNALCIACTVKIPTVSKFHLWFEDQPVLHYVPL